MPQRKPPFRLRLAKVILGNKAKEYIPSLSSIYDGWGYGSTGTPLNDYVGKNEQLQANLGWCFAANNAIVEPTAAVELKLYRKTKGGKREEIVEHELLDLLDNPNTAHTGEQLRTLHFSYMNFVGESYVYMRDSRGNAYEPAKGRLPAALEIFPAHLVQFTLGEAYSKSTVRYGQETYPLTSVIRDLNPDPSYPYYGRSIIRASAQTLDTEFQMKEWNRRFFANNARPSLIFSTNEPLDDEAYERWKKQFQDEHGGTENAYKPLLIEGGDAKPYMLNQQDLDFLNSRKFSRDEILAMWRVSPGIIGAVENVNRSNLEAGFYIHAVVNIRPRIRQFVRQLNASLVSIYDPTLELGFEDPVPEDTDARLKAAREGVNKWWTIDEVRDQYGDPALPDDLGSQVYMANNIAPLSAIAEHPKPGEVINPTQPSKSLKYKQVSANDFPGLYDDIDMVDVDKFGCIMINTERSHDGGRRREGSACHAAIRLA
jgi:HK97 family phage portal protein